MTEGTSTRDIADRSVGETVTDGGNVATDNTGEYSDISKTGTDGKNFATSVEDEYIGGTVKKDRNVTTNMADRNRGCL